MNTLEISHKFVKGEKSVEIRLLSPNTLSSLISQHSSPEELSNLKKEYQNCIIEELWYDANGLLHSENDEPARSEHFENKFDYKGWYRHGINNPSLKGEAW
jgi:hypothetical protein